MERVCGMDFDFHDFDVEKFEQVHQKALDALQNSPTPKEGLQRAHAVLKKEGLDESARIAIFSLIVNELLTQEGRKMILKEGHKKEVQEYFKKELGIAWSPGHFSMKEEDGSISEFKLMRYYPIDDPPSFVHKNGS